MNSNDTIKYSSVLPESEAHLIIWEPFLMFGIRKF